MHFYLIPCETKIRAPINVDHSALSTVVLNDLNLKTFALKPIFFFFSYLKWRTEMFHPCPMFRYSISNFPNTTAKNKLYTVVNCSILFLVLFKYANQIPFPLDVDGLVRQWKKPVVRGFPHFFYKMSSFFVMICLLRVRVWLHEASHDSRTFDVKEISYPE